MPELDMAQSLALDYMSTVPMDEKAPISIEVQDDGSNTGSARPPGRRLQDFVPSDSKLRSMDEYRAGRGEPVTAREPHRRGIIVERNGTYISGEDMRERIAARDTQIVDLAKKFYREKKSEIVEYMKALEVTQNATKPEKLEPNKAMRRALKVVKLGHPMTKADAMAKAREVVENQLRRKG